MKEQRWKEVCIVTGFKLLPMTLSCDLDDSEGVGRKENQISKEIEVWYDPSGNISINGEDLPSQDLDTFFKWMWPILRERCYDVEICHDETVRIVGRVEGQLTCKQENSLFESLVEAFYEVLCKETLNAITRRLYYEKRRR